METGLVGRVSLAEAVPVMMVLAAEIGATLVLGGAVGMRVGGRDGGARGDGFVAGVFEVSSGFVQDDLAGRGGGLDETDAVVGSLAADQTLHGVTSFPAPPAHVVFLAGVEVFVGEAASALSLAPGARVFALEQRPGEFVH